jgi:Ca-activated chloride channel homolog
MQQEVAMKRLWIVIALLALFGSDAQAGVLYARLPGSEFPVYNLRISHIRTTVRIVGQLAVTHVDEEFYNDNHLTLEGFYAFSLPEGAKVDGLWLWVDGQRRTFIVKTREEAQRLYDSVVIGQRRDPAILESLGKNRFQLKVFPINPRSSRRVEIRYFVPLPLTTDGWVHYRYPLNLSGYQTVPVEQTSLRVDVESKLPIDAITCNFDNRPTLCRTVQFDEHRFRTDFGLEQQMYTEDFEVRYKPRGIFSIFPALLWNDPAVPMGDPYFICWHPVDHGSGGGVPRDLVFILDASGSMDESRRSMVQDAVIGVLRQLTAKDRFRIVIFSSNALAWPNNLEGMVFATAENITAGIDYIFRMYLTGGLTNYEQALISGFSAVFRPDADHRMLFLTDGDPNAGQTSYDGLLEVIRTRDTSGVTLNPVIVFSPKIDLLYDLAAARGGKVTLVESGDDLQTVIERVMLDINVAGLRAAEVTYEQGRSYFVYPRTFPSIVGMQNLMTTGRLLGAPFEKVTLRYLGSESQHLSVSRDVDFSAWTTDLKQVGAFWAAKRIDDLLEQIRTQGALPELVESVVNLSIKHQVLSPYTAFLVLETNKIDPPTNMEHIQAAVPDGYSVHPPYPNPFSRTDGTSLVIPIELTAGKTVRIVVVDLLGREVAVLSEAFLRSGVQTILWDGRASDGSLVQPGVYFVRIISGNSIRMLKVLVIA